MNVSISGQKSYNGHFLLGVKFDQIKTFTQEVNGMVQASSWA